MPKLHLITYGCQMNEYDSERVAGLLGDARYELTESPDDADLVLLNTCAIREKAEEKVFSRLGQLKTLKRQRPQVLALALRQLRWRRRAGRVRATLHRGIVGGTYGR